MDSKVLPELKKKTGGIVHKRRFKMTLKEAYDFLESGKRPVATSYIDEQVINEISYFNKVSPVTFSSYLRLAFFGKAAKNFV